MIILHEIKIVFMNNKLVAPFITWLMFMLVDIASLIAGLQQHQNLLIMLAAMGFIAGMIYLYIIMRHDDRELKPIRVRVRK